MTNQKYLPLLEENMKSLRKTQSQKMTNQKTHLHVGDAMKTQMNLLQDHLAEAHAHLAEAN